MAFVLAQASVKLAVALAQVFVTLVVLALMSVGQTLADGLVMAWL